MDIDTAFCSVSNVAGAPTSFRILPAGRFRTNDGRPVGIDSFHLDAGLATELVKQAASNMNDYVIDYEHQSVRSAENGQMVRAAGWFKTLEWREGDGLYVTDVRWTATAAEMLKANEYRYISPVFGYTTTGDIVRLHSAAVTNVPALDGLTDLTAATHLTDPAALGGSFERQNDILKAHFGATAALVSSYTRGADGVVSLSDGSSASDAAMSDFERQQVNETLAVVFGKGATLI